MKYHHNWLILVNNYSEDDFVRLCDLSETTDYLIVGKAVARTGVLYLECFASFTVAKSYVEVKEAVGVCHCTPAIWAAGTIAYCRNCPTVYECGHRDDVIE